MADGINSLSIYLLPGMKAKIIIPVNPNDNTSFEATDSTTYTDADGESHSLTQGWYSKYTDVGVIESKLDSAKDGAGVLYWHKRPQENSLIYITYNPAVKFVVNIIAVPIHDHSSIVQGGPAYGTYFTDDS